MSDRDWPGSVALGDVDPAGSRHRGRRSAVALTGDRVLAGTAAGDLAAFDRGPLAEAWRTDVAEGSLVAARPFDGGVAVGSRGRAGTVALVDADGGVRWRYETRDDLGPPQKDTRFLLPFVASLATDGDRIYAAARRYERGSDGSRAFESAVYAFEPDGALVWTFRADASPISLDVAGDRVAVAYNRCPGDHRDGLVVLDAETGTERWRWDPEAGGQRRVGDVALLDEGAVAASHADYRGYRLGESGEERWRVDLATPRESGAETLYAYPNHVHASEGGVVFVTGNTYAEDSRETEGLHPDEHTAFGYSPAGDHRWSAPVGGFASGVGAAGSVLAVPVAQHFREPNPDAHAARVFDVREGPVDAFDAAGVVTAAATDGEAVAAVEEPVVYHDEGEKRGAYRLHLR